MRRTIRSQNFRPLPSDDENTGATPRQIARRVGMTGAASGLAALLCFAGPAAAFAGEPAAAQTPIAASAQHSSVVSQGLGVDLTATADHVSAIGGRTTTIWWSTLLGNDINPTTQPILLTSHTAPSHGTADFADSNVFSYTPKAGFVGEDIITYAIHDVYGDTNPVPGVVHITVTANAVPVAVVDRFDVAIGQKFVSRYSGLLGNDTDADSDHLYTDPAIFFGPSHGTAAMNSNNDGGFTYTPDAGYSGYDQFFYRVTDRFGGTSNYAAAEFTITKALFSDHSATFTGNSEVGKTLTAIPGTWGPAPVTLSYKWSRGTIAIAGATGKTYTLTAADAGKNIWLDVTGSKAGYASVTESGGHSAQVSVPAKTVTPPAVAPAISGAAVVGSTLTVASGAWSPAPVVLSYQWARNGSPISGATSTTYIAAPADVGQKLLVVVYGSKTGYASESVYTAQTAPVAAAAFTATPVPTVTGTAKVGSTLTAHAATWTPAATSVTYQWKRGGAAISGATASTYALTGADLAKTMTVVVSGAKNGYASISKTSVATAAVVAASLTATPVPTIAGTAKVGSTLTANVGTWSPAPVTLAYQWKSGGVAIAGATSKTYTLVAGSVGAKLTVTVTGTKAGYTPVSKTSASTVAVVK